MTRPLNVLFIPGLFGTALSKSHDRRQGKQRLWPTYEAATIWARNTELASEAKVYAAGLFDDYFLFNSRKSRAYREGFTLLLETITNACPDRNVAGVAALYDWRCSPLENAHRICNVIQDPGRWFLTTPDPLQTFAAFSPVGANALKIERDADWLIIAHSMGGLVAMELMDGCQPHFDIMGCVCVGAPVGGSIKAAQSLISGKSAANVVQDAVRALARNPAFEGAWSLAPPDLDVVLQAEVRYTRTASTLKSPMTLQELEEEIVHPRPDPRGPRFARRAMLAHRWSQLQRNAVPDIYFFGSDEIATNEEAEIAGADTRASWRSLKDEPGDDTVTYARSTAPGTPLPALSFTHQKQMYDPTLHGWLTKFLAGKPGGQFMHVPGLLIEPVDGAVDEGQPLEVFVRANVGQNYTLVVEATEAEGDPLRPLSATPRVGTGRFERVVLTGTQNAVAKPPRTFVLASVFDGHIAAPNSEQPSADTAVILVERADG